MTDASMGIGNPEFTTEFLDGRKLRVGKWAAARESGKAPILFFNGIGTNIEVMAPLARSLNDRDFIMFDMPGIGDSPDPVVPYNAIMVAHMAKALLDKFEIERADCLAVSWGGAMAQQFAFQHGGRVNKLVLMASNAGMAMVPGNPAAILKMSDTRWIDDPAFLKKHFKVLFGGDNGGNSNHLSRAKQPSKLGYFYQLMSIAGWTSAAFLPFLKKETLILSGHDDQIVPRANGKLLKKLIPNSELIEIVDGGHLFMLSHLAETCGAISEFLDRGDGAKIAA